MSGQLAFELPVRAALGRDAFFVAPANALALAAVDGWRAWPQGRLAVIGPQGSGKTHLAQVWAEALPGGARRLAGATLTAADAAAAGGTVIDDAAAVAGDAPREAALLHLLNLAQAEGRPVLLTARQAPARWGIRLPDLASRLGAVALAEIAPPDDALLAAVIVKLFADRQVAVGPAVVRYLLPRMERSLAAAAALVARLDALALARGQAVTPRLAAEALGGWTAGAPAGQTG